MVCEDERPHFATIRVHSPGIRALLSTDPVPEQPATTWVSSLLVSVQHRHWGEEASRLLSRREQVGKVSARARATYF